MSVYQHCWAQCLTERDQRRREIHQKDTTHYHHCHSPTDYDSFSSWRHDVVYLSVLASMPSHDDGKFRGHRESAYDQRRWQQHQNSEMIVAKAAAETSVQRPLFSRPLWNSTTLSSRLRWRVANLLSGSTTMNLCEWTGLRTVPDALYQFPPCGIFPHVSTTFAPLPWP